MKIAKRLSYGRKLFLATAVIMLLEQILPTQALALTSGPAQPEFSSFEPVATTNMVNDFNGDFTYNLPVLNIPGANGGGYALSLSYHSGASTEEESSWVGYGWTLNPGSISRNKRGFADDDNGVNIRYWNDVPANKTVSVGISANMEAWSADIPFSANASLRYNNYKGFGYSSGLGLQFANGLISLGFNVSDGLGSFSVRINPVKFLSNLKEEKNKKDPPYNNKKKRSEMTSDDKKKDNEERKKVTKAQRDPSNLKNYTGGAGAFTLAGSNYGILTRNSSPQSFSLTKYYGEAYHFTASVLAAVTPLQVGPTFDLSGSFTWQQNVNSNGTPHTYDAIPAYGYMYSGNAGSSGNTMMDYYMEKMNPFDKQDKYLGMPFSNADNYSVSGEGLGGSFRLINRKAGHFRPNEVESKSWIFNIGAEVEAGLNIGGGMDVGLGYQQLSSNNWDNTVVGNYPFADTDEDEFCFFRFTNDQGGSVEFGADDGPKRAGIVSGGDKGFKPQINSSDFTTTMNDGERSGRSSYISYHTNAQMMLSSGGYFYKRYAQGFDTAGQVYRNGLPDAIGEITTFNEDGARYVYGLPVYARKEQSIQYDLKNVPASSIENNYIAYKNISSYTSKVGEERNDPYATTYLLTEITSPDYIDRNFDGPSDDDYGGYTRFSYTRVHGSYDKEDYNDTTWYKWRIPYRGLHMNRGEISTQKDDMGNIMYGEKEIYYLDSIITKTHFAVFVTTDRTDGLASKDNATMANSSTAKGSRKLKRLDRIDLYAKNPGGSPKLIKTIRFEYDYSLCSGVYNTTSTVAGSDGKLSLKKVWFEYDGVVSAKISPYVFEYAYSTAQYPDKYNNLEAANYYPAGLISNQNPNYSPFNIDPWGNYQYGGASRFDDMKNWVNQDTSGNFDPAAWQLKVIKLPTGGEIHIQYEQDDYLWVQNERAQTMMSLSSITDASDPKNIKYYLNTQDVGVVGASPTSNDTLKLLRGLISNQYLQTGDKMYFKFLYSLVGSDPQITKCNSEYITGYCTVNKVDIDASGLYVQLGTAGGGLYNVPKKVCVDYVKTQRLGTLNSNGHCDPQSDGITSGNSAGEIVQNLVNFVNTVITPGNSELCTEINESLSYLRVPVIFNKKGGGVRVKRILMYDAGIESGDKSLFGSEYIYEDDMGRSSGVATNEPGEIREENALVKFDPKLKQSFLDKVVSGRDREVAETPLGEHLLPSPSIGYSRVVIRNIHTGKTNPGFIVKEYHTAREFPMVVQSTELEMQKKFIPIPGGLINIFINKIWASQGYVFKLNNMHGQPKSETTYKGDPDDYQGAVISSKQEFSYFQPGEQIPVMHSLNSITWENPGKETELVFESRGMEDISHDGNLEFDIDVGLAFIPIPFFSAIPSYTYTENKLYAHTTTKVINYPVIQKSVKSYADGIYHLSEHVAFSGHTGKPILTRTYDGYNELDLQQSMNHSGRYYAYTFPAADYYKSMGQKAKNETKKITSDNATVQIQKKSTGGQYYLEFTPATGYSVCDVMKSLYPGDLIRLTKKSDNSALGFYHVRDSVSGNNLFLYESSFFATSATVNQDVIIEVLRSGRTNQLNTYVGGFTTYGDTARVSYNWDPNELADRQEFVDSLNYYINTPGYGTLFSTSIPIGLSYINASGNCVSMHDSTYAITFSTGAAQDLQMTLFTDPGLVGCSESFSDTTGYFGLDEMTKQLMYFTAGNQCFGVPVTCFKFCPDQISTTKVVVADAKTFDDNWDYDTSVYPTGTGTNKYECGEKGKWRLLANYIYKDTIIGANGSGERNYKDAGVFTLQLFNWFNTSLNDTAHWIELNTVTKYAPDGNALEEQDIMGIYSTAKFGYDNTQPTLVAKNADYGSVQFDGFEKSYNSNTKLEDGWSPSNISANRTSTTAHSGQYSWNLGDNGTAGLPLKDLVVTDQLLDAGLLLKVWLRDDLRTQSVPVTSRIVKGTTDSLYADFSKVAQVGQWGLFECKISGDTLAAYFSAGDTITPKLFSEYALDLVDTDTYIDDIRVQPGDAQMIAYVYDRNSLRLIATFDDQHFGLFYQYNAEGKLVRKMVETERGMKTITETQYHTPTQSR